MSAKPANVGREFALLAAMAGEPVAAPARDYATPAAGLITAIQSRVPWDDYLAIDALSISRLKELRRSPQHYRYLLANPKESAPLTLGRAAHCAVLEPERFEADHAVWGRRTASGNLAPRNGGHWDTFQADHAGKTIITADEFDKVKAIQAAVRNNPDAMRYLQAGDPEVTMRWATGNRQCKGRIDWLTHVDGPVLVGLKSARDCRLRQFGRQAANLGYHLQWAYYFDGFKTITGAMPKVVEIVVESEGPHAVAVYVIPDEIVQQGCDEYLALLEQLRECERTNAWPGPVIGETPLTLPAWVYGEEEIAYVDE